MDCVRRELIHFVKVNLWELKVGCCGTSLGSDRHIGSTSTTDRLPVFTSLQEQVIKREPNQFQIFLHSLHHLLRASHFFAVIQLNCSQLILVTMIGILVPTSRAGHQKWFQFFLLSQACDILPVFIFNAKWLLSSCQTVHLAPWLKVRLCNLGHRSYRVGPQWPCATFKLAPVALTPRHLKSSGWTASKTLVTFDICAMIEDNDDDHAAMGSMERTRELNLLRRR